MNIENMTTVANEALAQTLGEQYNNSVSEGEIIVTDLANLCAWAKKATNGNYANISTEKWFNAVIDKVYKIEVDTRKLPVEIPSVYKDSHKWGAFLERVKFDLFEIKKDPVSDFGSSQLTGAAIAAMEYDTYKNNAKAEIFSNKQAFMIPFTKPAELLYSCVTNENEFMKLIAGIENAVDLTKTAVMNTATKDLVTVAIAKCIENDNVIHLLTECKTLGILGSTATSADFRKSNEAIAYAMRRMFDIRGNFVNLDKSYTGGNGFATFSPLELQHGIMLNQFKNIVEFTAAANTYHNGKLTTDFFDSVNNWQGIKTPTSGDVYEWNTISSIKVKANTNAGISDDIETNNIISIIFDEKAIGITNMYEKTTSKYRATMDDVNSFVHCRYESIVDDDYKMCVFMID